MSESGDVVADPPESFENRWKALMETKGLKSREPQHVIEEDRIVDIPTGHIPFKMRHQVCEDYTGTYHRVKLFNHVVPVLLPGDEGKVIEVEVNFKVREQDVVSGEGTKNGFIIINEDSDHGLNSDTESTAGNDTADQPTKQKAARKTRGKRAYCNFCYEALAAEEERMKNGTIDPSHEMFTF